MQREEKALCAPGPHTRRGRRRRKAHTSDWAPALRMRKAVSSLREREASAKGGGLLGAPALMRLRGRGVPSPAAQPPG